MKLTLTTEDLKPILAEKFAALGNVENVSAGSSYYSSEIVVTFTPRSSAL